LRDPAISALVMSAFPGRIIGYVDAWDKSRPRVSDAACLKLCLEAMSMEPELLTLILDNLAEAGVGAK
jgi:hypothetical protein